MSLVVSPPLNPPDSNIRLQTTVSYAALLNLSESQHNIKRYGEGQVDRCDTKVGVARTQLALRTHMFKGALFS